MVDVGNVPTIPNFPAGQSFYEMRQRGEDLSGLLVGEAFESLEHLRGRSLSPKLKSPGMSFVTKAWGQHLEPRLENFSPEFSYAKGGFANAWGGGCFRFTAKELESFPFASQALEAYYDKLTAEMGICGQADDLEPYFGSTAGLLPALRLSAPSARFLGRYEHSKASLRAKGYSAGRPRLAVLTEGLRGRSPYAYEGLDFQVPHQSAVYTPAFTIDRLIKEGALQYLPGLLVRRIREVEGVVEIVAERLEGGGTETIRARKCILAAGAIGTAVLALSSFGGAGLEVPLRENPTSLMVLFDPAALGKPQALRGYGGAQLSLIYQGRGQAEPIQASLYDLSPVLRSDVLFDLPFPARSLPVLSRLVIPSFLILQTFYPDSEAGAGGGLSIDSTGRASMRYKSLASLRRVEGRFMRDLLPLGYLSIPPMWKLVPPGQCFHYAGTLPMRAQPGPFECDSDGRLGCTQNVYVADAANFPRLPSKNLTFTAMANAWRIAEGVSATLK